MGSRLVDGIFLAYRHSAVYPQSMGELPNKSDELLVPIDAKQGAAMSEFGMTEPRYFPSPTLTNPDGLLCVGGKLTPDWLLDAYRHGIFPWPVWEEDPMAWWSPNPRAVLELDSLHVTRRLDRTLKGSRFTATCDQNFVEVIQSCSSSNGRKRLTWLIPEMIEAYTELHRLGHAHSVEVWQNGELAGGTYGVAIGGLFAAESMFYRVRDGSKVALFYLVAHLRARGYRLLDVQQWTPHTGRLGAMEIPRAEYLSRLATARDLAVTFGDKLEGNSLESSE